MHQIVPLQHVTLENNCNETPAFHLYKVTVHVLGLWPNPSAVFIRIYDLDVDCMQKQIHTPKLL